MKLDALFTLEGSGNGTLRFEIKNDSGEHVGYYLLEVPPTEFGTTDAMLARGHRQMASIVRKWSDRLTELAVEFESR